MTYYYDIIYIQCHDVSISIALNDSRPQVSQSQHALDRLLNGTHRQDISTWRDSLQESQWFPTNPVSPWELRIDRFRVFYSIEEGNEVKVIAVGHKEHNVLFIRGKKIEL